jgi:hypothetical protein
VRRAALVVLAGMLCVACARGSVERPPAPEVYVLTGANELVGATASGRVVIRRQLARSQRASSPSPRLALDAGRLFVLVRRDVPPDRLVALDAATARLVVSRTLPADFHARAVVAGSGRVFVAGNRPAGRVAPGIFAEDAVVLELNYAARIVRRFTVREANGRDWWVASAALSPDRERLAISYHGGCSPDTPQLCTGGADVIDLERGAREPCIEPFPSSGCVDAHGHVEFLGDSVLVATGSQQIRIVRGATLDTRLGNSHVMNFAIDPVRDELFAAGPCHHLGGLSHVELTSGTARLLVPPQGPTTPVCGNRVALLPRLVAVAPIGTAVAEPRTAGRVLLVDRRNGRVRARIALDAEPVDVLSVRSSG